MTWHFNNGVIMVQVTRNRQTRSMAQGGKFINYSQIKTGEVLEGILTKEGLGTKYPKPNYTLLVEKSTLTGTNVCKEGEFVVLNWSKILEDGIEELRKATNRNTGFFMKVIFSGLTPKKDYKKGQPVTNQNHYFKMDVQGDVAEFAAPSVAPAVISDTNDDLDLE